MKPEAKVKKAITAILKEFDVYYFMPRGTALGRSGIPDYVCCYYGWFLGIEAKAEGNTTSALQQRELDDIMVHRGLPMVINESNLDELRRVLTAIRERTEDHLARSASIKDIQNAGKEL